jgi:predicted membrane channel-forming protein YqfA (hemolysin III family)
MQRLDHAAIWVLIAATFTPIHLVLCRAPWRWGVLGIVWGASLAGLHLARTRGMAAVAPLLWGGVAYSAGALVEAAPPVAARNPIRASFSSS